MWRFLFGVGLLAALMGMGFYCAHAIEESHEPIARTLEQAAQAAPDQAKTLLEQAKKDWEHHWHGTAALSDHTPMDEVDSLFAQVQAYAETDNRADFSAFCLRLAQLLRAIADQHQSTWWNFL